VAPAEPTKPDSLEKRLTWLDDQRRKDAELLRKLASQLKVAEDLVGKHNRQLQEFSSELSRLAAVAAKIQAVDETLSKHRQEVSRQLESAETRRAEREKSLEQLRRKDHDEVARGIGELRHEMSGLVDLRRDFDSRRDEEVRLARSVGSLAERLDALAEAQQGQEQALAGHEDSHKQEARRSADLQTEVTDLRLRLEGLRGSLDTVEDRIRQLEIRSAEFSAAEVERRESTSAWMEGQNLRMADLERVWGEYARRFEAFEKRAGEIDERVRTFEDTHRAMRQLQAELGKTLERLERRIAEIGEVQRLGEDRQKQEWSGFLAEDQRRWSAFKLSHDEQNQEHTRLHQRLAEEVTRLEETTTQALQGSIRMEDSTQRRLTELLAMLREWAGEAERRPTRVR
jgi:chromosome segregation ATPase